MEKYLIRADLNDEIRHWINTTLRKYLTKNEENQTEIEHIIDFLLSDMAPKRLQRMSYAQAKAGAEQWNVLLQKRGASIQESEDDVKSFIRYKSGFRFVQLVGKAAFEREGSLMRHCVGSYHNKSDVKIYSLRDPHNMPHCTIEVTGDKNVQQIKGKGNGSIHPNYIKYVMSFLKKIGMPVRSTELSNLGYDNLEDVQEGMTTFIKKSFKGAKFKKINGVEYFYKHSKLEQL